ncbi:CAP domain-containing protein [Bernardetia sp.]|uniref:CAP domain-containing protein n=1 Tax=Bernardetia sp. TaxID=1937974 RepID=UPI0025BB63F8|nr:CAP domain-containing protein [Bernardetia sp.]
MKPYHIKLGVILFCFSTLMFSCQVEDEEDTDTSTVPTGFNVDGQKLVDLVNQQRTQGCICGSEQMPPVNPISWNETLAKAAYLHSKDMSENNYFSHTGKNGSDAGERIENQGYIWRTYGENIAEGYTTEEAVIEGWLNSEGHCKNIMKASFEEMGVGREANYWTQVFGAQR